MILAYLEDRNLFLIALDDERRWYRYHSLFADLLRVRFNAGTAAQTAVLIQRRAAAWFEQQGDTRKAIRYFIQGGAYEEAARLVENQTIHLFSQGELQALVDAVQLLPAQLAERRPWLSIYQAWAMAFAGQLDQVERLLSIARLALTQEPPHAQDEHAMEAEMTAIRALSATQAGDFASVLPLADRLDLFPEDRLFASSVIYWSLGYAWRMLGDLPRAITAFRQVMALGERLNNRWTLLTASVDLGTVLRQTGRLEEAERIYRQGLERVSRPGGSGQGMLGRLESFLAGILYEKNELEEAGQLAENSVAHGQLWDNPNHVAHAHWMLARTRLARGDVHGAERVLKTAEEVAAKPAVVPSLKVSIEAERVRFWLSSGDLQRAQVWLAGQSLATGSTPLSETAVVVLTLAARVKIASGDTDGAAAVIDRLEANHRAGGRINDLIEALVLRALASGSTPAARSALDEALALGLPAGYRRIYLDHGARLRVLLVQWRAEIRSVSPAALDDLLAAFPQETAPDSAPQSADSILTDREIEILARMAEGLTNQEIGRRLYISTGTVKAHSAAIYRKLDVANRAEAIARAKDLNLL
jgi:LuxR family maltose regulon positive regulatory protein